MYQSGLQAAAGNAAKASIIDRMGRKLAGYALENPVKLASVTVLGYGALVLFAYFVHIRFLPDVNLEAATSLLYAAAVMGSLLTGFMALTLVVPGLMLALWRGGSRTSRIGMSGALRS